MLDMATSVVAGGKVFAAAALGKPIPEGWIMDLEAKPTRDATLFSEAATLYSLGGYKGFCIAFMIEVLAAVLTGSAISREVLSWTFSDLSKPTGHGAAFMAINIATFIEVDFFKQRMDHLIKEIHERPKSETGELFAPGEIEFRRRENALKNGIDLPADVVANLQGLADDLGMKLPNQKNS